MSKQKANALIPSLVGEMRRFIAGAILFNQSVADALGVNLTDHQVINLLELRGPCTPGELAQLTGLSSGGVTVVLDRLENANYIKRERHPRDRRSVLVKTVSSRETANIHKLYEPIEKAMDEIFSGYDEKQLRLILDFFTRTNQIRKEGLPGVRR